MPYLMNIVIFWVMVCVIIRLLTYFPDSLLARIAFSRQGPVPIRGELRSRYLLRWATFAGGWFAQALGVFLLGWCLLLWDPLLVESTLFLTFWAVVVPLLGSVGLLGTVVALGASFWVRHFGADQVSLSSTNAVQT